VDIICLTELHLSCRPQIYAILKQTLEKLALVGVITVDPKVQAHELTQSVGEEISRMIAEQKKLEGRFEELVAMQHVLRHQPNKTKLMENQVSWRGGPRRRGPRARGTGGFLGQAPVAFPHACACLCVSEQRHRNTFPSHYNITMWHIRLHVNPVDAPGHGACVHPRSR
jgi:hypothetical protein